MTHTIPREGMMAVVRNRRAMISGVQPFDAAEEGRFHLVEVEYADGTGAELALRKTHYERVQERLAAEAERTLERVLPPRYALRGEARVYPIAVEIRLPGRLATRPDSGGELGRVRAPREADFWRGYRLYRLIQPKRSRRKHRRPISTCRSEQ